MRRKASEHAIRKMKKVEVTRAAVHRPQSGSEDLKVKAPGAVAPPEAVVSPQPQALVFPVVGLGASAGGLEAFTQLLHTLPNNTGMAFVLIQHLDPKHESMLSEILSRSTPMPVREVNHATPVAPNHIYVTPRGVNLYIRDRILQLTPRKATREMPMPIDYFLRSLAEDLGNKAIGVILSGTGSDGSLGLKAIKVEGGITFAQDEKSAKYDGMPHSAV